MLLDQAAESSHVVIIRKVKYALTLLMYIPKDVEADSIHAESLAHLDAMFPILARYTGVVKLSRLDHERLAPEEESLVADRESLFALSGGVLAMYDMREQ